MLFQYKNASVEGNIKVEENEYLEYHKSITYSWIIYKSLAKAEQT